MKIEKYRKEYLASLYGRVYEADLDRTFPIVRQPDLYTNWCEQNTPTYKKLESERIWLASDHHFGHKNIMKYADRQFSSVQEMNQHMIECHNRVVSSDDVIVLGGDIAFCSTSEANRILAQMNGYKVLIIGNHDWERDKTLKQYDVDEVHMSYYIEKQHVLITHVPLHSSLMVTDNRLLNIHGHIHDKLMKHPRYYNMCVEHLNYTPQLLTNVVQRYNWGIDQYK